MTTAEKAAGRQAVGEGPRLQTSPSAVAERLLHVVKEALPWVQDVKLGAVNALQISLFLTHSSLDHAALAAVQNCGLMFMSVFTTKSGVVTAHFVGHTVYVETHLP